MMSTAKTGFVYVLRSKTQIKVGFSFKPNRRWNEHRSAHMDLQFIGHMAGTVSRERDLQLKLKRLFGLSDGPVVEWFPCTIAVSTRMRRLSRPSRNGYARRSQGKRQRRARGN